MSDKIVINQNLHINENQIDWLQNIIRDRINDQLTLNISGDQIKFWQLSFLQNEYKIYAPIADCYYKLGLQPDLPNTYIVTPPEFKYPIQPSIPIPGVKNPPKNLLEIEETKLTIGFDLFGLIYWMLSRSEEVNPPNDILDVHKRFPAFASHAFKNGYLKRPIIDEWLIIFAQVLQKVWPEIKLKTNEYRLKISHDVDSPACYSMIDNTSLIKRIISRALKRKNISSIVKGPLINIFYKDKLHPKDPFNTFDWIMDISESLNLKSSFNFICGRTNPRFDSYYDIEYDSIKQLILKLNSRGHEIGCHPSYETFNNPQKLDYEARRFIKILPELNILQESWGGRMHFLKWEWPNTAYALSSSGFHYDSTLGFADQAGFRCGTCFEYQLFDPIKKIKLNLVERPLVAMECSVLFDKYQGKSDTKEAFDVFKELKDNCRSVHGTFTLLWHNSQLDQTWKKDLYLKILKA